MYFVHAKKSKQVLLEYEWPTDGSNLSELPFGGKATELPFGGCPQGHPLHFSPPAGCDARTPRRKVQLSHYKLEVLPGKDQINAFSWLLCEVRAVVFHCAAANSWPHVSAPAPCTMSKA
jgi:hypothetical protein